MHVAYASRPGGTGRNEDHVASGPTWAFVLDGATAPPRAESGCRHGAAWLVERLGAALGGRLALPEPPLPDVLAAAIRETCAAHAHQCDLSAPDSPSATAAIVRRTHEGFDYLVLADSAVLLPGPGGTVTVHCDRRADRLPGGRPYSPELVRRHRNVPGGFWVAGTRPEAAYHALTGTVRSGDPRFGLLTDGCTRLVDLFGHPWEAVWRTLAADGPEAVIDRVRREEHRKESGAPKRHDDATALYGEFPAVVRER